MKIPVPSHTKSIIISKFFSGGFIIFLCIVILSSIAIFCNLIFDANNKKSGMPENVTSDTLPKKGSLGDVTWYIEKQIGRIFYFTRGAVVWGHEFGFWKHPDYCSSDTIWLVFSSSDDGVKDFIDKQAVVSLDVDGEVFEVELDMWFAGTIGFTHVMYFTNRLAEQQLINKLRTGHKVKVQIIEPKELEVLLDIKEDTFDLGGFINSRKQAEELCKDCSPQKKQEIEERKEYIMIGKSPVFTGYKGKNIF